MMQKCTIPEDWTAWNVLVKSSIPLIDALVEKRMTNIRNVFPVIDHLHIEIVAEWILSEPSSKTTFWFYTSSRVVNIMKIVVETKEERLAAGKPVGHDVPYIAMGGITGFSSLIDGSQRLDPSGVGDSIGNMYRALEWPNRSKFSKCAQKILFLYFIYFIFL